MLILRNLTLDDTGISSLTPLANLYALRNLKLERTGVSDLTPLADLASLTRLNIDETDVTDLFPIFALDKLERLSLNETQVTGPVAELCRSFNRVLYAKGETIWHHNIQQNSDRKRCA